MASSGIHQTAAATEHTPPPSDAELLKWKDQELYQPNQNFAPGCWAPVLRIGADGLPMLQTMQWGLVPSFHKPDQPLDHWKMFNARLGGALGDTAKFASTLSPVLLNTCHANVSGRAADNSIGNCHRSETAATNAVFKHLLRRTHCEFVRGFQHHHVHGLHVGVPAHWQRACLLQ